MAAASTSKLKGRGKPLEVTPRTPTTEAQENLAWELINNPPPRSEIAKARKFGGDLTLVIRSLRRTPTERARVLPENARIFQPAEQNASPENGIWKRRFEFAARRPG